jgi:hypothetical protein
MMSGSNEWDAHLNGKTAQYNFSYRPAMTTSDAVNTPPQMQQSTNKLVLPASANKTASALRTKQNGSKKNHLPPPSPMIVRGGKHKGKRKYTTRKRKGTTHKKMR